MPDDVLSLLATRYGVADTLSRGVLLVDDEPGNLAVLRDFLDEDYMVYDACSGAEALARLASTPIDVMIADHRMPEMTGVDLLERVHEQRPDIAGILLTAYTDTPVLISAINRARVFRHLKKPWQPEEILAAVAQASVHVQNERLIRRLVDQLARRTEELGGALENLRATQQQVLHLERLGTMGRLAAGITHDLRNTVQGLALVEARLAGFDLPVEVRRVLEVGVAGMGNLLGTLSTINQFAAGGKLRLKPSRLNPGEILRDAETVLHMDMNYRERRVTYTVAEDVPTVYGDRPKLVQVLVNLVRNALQATQPGQSIWIRAEVAADGVLVVSVEDEGPGVSAELEQRLFQPFVSTRGDQGMGMGLYMARLVVESHGGTLQYLARSGGGARFEVHLPTSASRADMDDVDTTE